MRDATCLRINVMIVVLLVAARTNGHDGLVSLTVHCFGIKLILSLDCTYTTVD